MFTDGRHYILSYTLCLLIVAFTDGNWIDQARDQHRCVMEEAEFAWTYDETVAALDTIVITTGNPPVELLRKKGETPPVPEHDRVKFLPNAGITLKNLTLKDAGSYKVEINFKNDTLNLVDDVRLYMYDCPKRSAYENPFVTMAHNGSNLLPKEGRIRVRQEDSATLEVTVYIPRASPAVRANVTIHPPIMHQCITTVEPTTETPVITTVRDPTVVSDTNATEVTVEETNANDTDARLRRELAKNGTAEEAGERDPATQAPTDPPTPAPTTEDPCAVPLEPVHFTCDGDTDADYQCDIVSELERDGVYTVEVIMTYDGGHPDFKPIRKEIEVQFNGPFPRDRMSLTYILLITGTVLLAVFLFIMLFLAFVWCIEWCKSCTCCSCRSRNRSQDKQDQELLSHEDALDGDCEKCEETVPLSAAPADVVRGKRSQSKGSLSASKGSLTEPKTPDRDLDVVGNSRKPASRRSSGGKRTPQPSPYDKERRRKKYWALRNAWMAANILQRPVKSGDQEPQTPDSMDEHMPV